MSALLAIEHLSVDYGTPSHWTPALKEFSLHIAPGEAVGLVGPSGSGKSTVALAILGLIRNREGRIRSGRILFNGQDLLTFPETALRAVRGRDIAMIFQDPFTALNPVLTIRTQLSETLQAHGFNVQEEALLQALDDVQLEPERVLHSYPHQLSGGQRQRVMIAMALLCKPQLILADEPTTALDVIVQKNILTLLFSLQKKMNAAVLFISHHSGLIQTYTQRRVELYSGREESIIRSSSH